MASRDNVDGAAAPGSGAAHAARATSPARGDSPAEPAAAAGQAEMLLPYEEQLLAELQQTKNALVIMAAGLSWHKVAAALICQHSGFAVDGGGCGSEDDQDPGSEAAALPAARQQQQQQQLQQQRQAAPRGALIIVGATPVQRTLLASEVHRLAPQSAAPVEITSEVASVERGRHYASGAACCVTTRILVVDLLSSRLRPDMVRWARGAEAQMTARGHT